MKIYLSLILSATLLLLLTNKVLSNELFIMTNITDTICWDVPDPTNLSHKIQKSCSTVKSRKRASEDKMFTVSFSCLVEDHKSELCQKVKNTFDLAGQIIASGVKLNTPLAVNATLVDFCKTIGICSTDSGRLTLGGAGPARLIHMVENGVQRVYPQPLLKQLVKGDHPEYSPFDIIAQFNSEGDYWFEGDSPIKPNQSDFLFVILHELIHGLGFVSGWNDYSDILGVPNIITPSPLILQSNLGQIVFGGFKEFIFDKFMVLLPDGTRASDITAELNKFSGIGTRHSSIGEFLNFFMSTFPSSPQYKIAQRMMNIATMPKSLGILALDKNDTNDAFILETSLVPYLTGSSIGHCDYKTYTKNPDFLMRYLQDTGISLRRSIRLGGNYAGGPIGPKLSETLSLIGYQTQDLPNPFKPNPNEVGKTSTASSSLRTFKIIKFLFLLLFGYRLYNLDGLF